MGVVKNNPNDINRTTARTLVNATGISYCLAKAIIHYRKQKQNNPIQDFQELWKVPGMTSEDYEAIVGEFKKSAPHGKQPVTKDNVKEKNKDSESKENPTSSNISLQGRNTAKNRRKRERKKRKKQKIMESTQPEPSSLKHDNGKINSKAINQRIQPEMNKKRLSHNGFPIPNLLVNPEWESPQNTLIILTGGNSKKQMYTPCNVESYQDGQEFVVRYRNKPQINNLMAQSSDDGKQTTYHQDGLRSSSTSPDGRQGSGSERRNQSRSRSRSRSSKSTTASPPEKRSRSNPPSNSDYSCNNVKIKEIGSVVPQDPGSSTLRSDITIPANEDWAKNDHESVRNWLAGVRTENIISSNGKTSVRSISADSRLTTGGNTTCRRLDFDQEKPSISERKSSEIGQRKPNEFDGNYPTMSREKSKSSGIFSSKPVPNVMRKSREKNSSLKRHRHESRHHKSRHHWRSRVNPEDGILEDERRPIEVRLDRRRDDINGITANEMRRARKQDLERLQQRHRAKSRARSRAAWRRRIFNCSIM